MTDQQHPITPPPELMEAWSRAVNYNEPTFAQVAIKAARWGADQELEACCADIHTVCGQQKAVWLRSMRRPKPPSLKEQALAALDEEQAEMSLVNYKTIRAVLESLPS